MWAWHSFGPSQFLETQPLAQLALALPPGSQVSLNARRISEERESVAMQASAVWTARQPPEGYKVPGLLQDLTLRLSDYMFLTTKEEKYRTNPLAGAPDKCVPGHVIEYISSEAGVVRLDGGEGAAIFHLEQVWTMGRKGLEKLKGREVGRLQDTLAIGSRVLLNVRKLPANPSSSLCYQATILWLAKEEEKGSARPLPKEYLTLYQPMEERRRLVRSLDRSWDGIKLVTRMDFPRALPTDGLVQAVMPGLPRGWMAQVVECGAADFGKIRVTTSSGEQLFVLFHLEEVWDDAGVPALKSCLGLQMSGLVGRRVELVARSICREGGEGAAGVMALARRWRGLPVLQAVVVRLLRVAGEEGMHPCTSPTVLREVEQADFSGGRLASFYLDPALGPRLNLKLGQWLLAAPADYSKLLAKGDKRRQEDKMEAVMTLCKKLDTGKTDRFVYGDFRPGQADNPKRSLLPELLEGHSVRLVYLHRPFLKAEWGVGEVEVMSGTSSTKEVLRMFSGDSSASLPPPETLRTLVLFRLSDYQFFTPPDYFASDLANVMPVSSTDKFWLHAKRVLASGPVPYVATALWNESLRREIGAELPDPLRTLDAKAVSSSRELLNNLLKREEEQDSSSEEEEENEEVDEEVPLPEDVGRVIRDVTVYSRKRLVHEGGVLVRGLEDQEGRVEAVLSDHLAIVTFKARKDKAVRRVLCSSDDVFSDLDTKRTLFSSSTEVLCQSARSLKVPLGRLLKEGQKVSLNTVPLVTGQANDAEIHYSSCGLLVSKEVSPTPIHCLQTANSFTEEFRLFHMKVLKQLDRRGRPYSNPNSSSSLFSPSFSPPEKFSSKDRKGRPVLRREYRKEEVRVVARMKEAARPKKKVVKISSFPAPVSSVKQVGEVLHCI